jgi:thiol-disulfide isomerase/thioredoxin
MNVQHRTIARSALLTLALLVISACGAKDPIDARRGSWLFINYWAQWCKPCRHEVPELNALDAEANFAVLGVNYDGAVDEALQEQEAALSIAFPTLAEDPAARYGVARPEVLPTTLVIDPQGRLHRVLIGPQTQETLRAATASGQEQG